MPSFGQNTREALAHYLVDRFNLAGRDADYAKNQPTLSAIPRDSNKLKGAGGTLHETIKMANGYGGSYSWTEAMSGFNPAKTYRWDVSTPYVSWNKVSFDNTLLAQSPGGTLLDIAGDTVEGAKMEMLNNLEYEIWNDGSGARGRAASVSGTATMVVTLTNPAEVYNFPLNANVNGNTARDGSGTARTNRYKVIDIDPVAGTVTLSRTQDNTSPLVANDYIHTIGDTGVSMPGIQTFIPAVAPSDTLLGVARTGNPALSGWRFPFKSSIGETIQTAFSQMGRYVDRAGRRFVVALPTSDWLALSLEKQANIVHDPVASLQWGLSALTCTTTMGPVSIVSYPAMTDGRGYILDWNTWKLLTLDNVPHIADEDGLVFRMGGFGAPDGHTNGDLLQVLLRRRQILVCNRPIGNGTFPTA